MGKILLWVARAMMGATVFLASVGPNSLQSNVSEWLELAGFENLPTFLLQQQVDQPITLVAFALFAATFVPWPKLRDRLFDALPSGSRVTAQQPTPVLDIGPIPVPPLMEELSPEPEPRAPAPLDIDLMRAEHTLKAERDRKIAEAAALRKQKRKEKANELLELVERLRPTKPTPPGVIYPMQSSREMHITGPLRAHEINWHDYAQEEIAKVKGNALYCNLNTPEEAERFKTPEAKQEFYCKHARVDGMVRAIKEWEKRDD